MRYIKHGQPAWSMVRQVAQSFGPRPDQSLDWLPDVPLKRTLPMFHPYREQFSEIADVRWLFRKLHRERRARESQTRCGCAAPPAFPPPVQPRTAACLYVSPSRTSALSRQQHPSRWHTLLTCDLRADQVHPTGDQQDGRHLRGQRLLCHHAG